MGKDEKLANTAQELRGKAKEKVGETTGDEGLRAQGARDQASADLKQAAEKVKDAFR